VSLQGPRLAPLYDLLTTTAYPELSPKFAMRVGKRATLSELDAKGWAAFAADAGMGLPLVRRRVGEMSEKTIDLAKDTAVAIVTPGLDEAALIGFADSVKERAEQCTRTFR